MDPDLRRAGQACVDDKLALHDRVLSRKQKARLVCKPQEVTMACMCAVKTWYSAYPAHVWYDLISCAYQAADGKCTDTKGILIFDVFANNSQSVACQVR